MEDPSQNLHMHMGPGKSKVNNAEGNASMTMAVAVEADTHKGAKQNNTGVKARAGRMGIKGNVPRFDPHPRIVRQKTPRHRQGLKCHCKQTSHATHVHLPATTVRRLVTSAPSAQSHSVHAHQAVKAKGGQEHRRVGPRDPRR